MTLVLGISTGVGPFQQLLPCGVGRLIRQAQLALPGPQEHLQLLFRCAHPLECPCDGACSTRLRAAAA